MYFGINIQGIFLQKKNLELGSSASTFNDIYEKRITLREALRAHWRCETHTVGERPVPCWRDGVTTQCYAMTENDLNLWADLQVRRQNLVALTMLI